MTEDDTRYRMRPRERTAVTPLKPAGDPAERAPDPSRFATGSGPDIPVIPPLAVPAAGATRVRFGDAAVIVERHGDVVTLVFPGGVRVQGNAGDAALLAAALAARPGVR